LVLIVGLFENLDELSGILDPLINPEDISTNLIYRFIDTIFVSLLIVHTLW